MLNQIFISKNCSFLYSRRKNCEFNQISKQAPFLVFCDFKSFACDLIFKNQVKIKKKGKTSYVTLCPFHQEKTPSFHIEQEKGLYYCFGCGESGNLYTFVKKINQKKHTRFEKDLIHDVLYYFNQTKKKFSKINRNNSHLVSYQSVFFIKTECDFYEKFFHRDMKLTLYTETRGLSNSILKLYKIGYSYVFKKNDLNIYGFGLNTSNLISETNYRSINLLEKSVQNKVVMPIFNEKGIAIGFGKRSTENLTKISKYINSQDSPIFKKQRCIYSSYHFKIVNKFKPKIGILVEGYMDFTNLTQNGIRFCMASLGTNVNNSHIQKLFSFNKNKHIIISFDCDRPGLASTRTIISNLFYFIKNYQFKTSFSYFNVHKDPDELVYFKGGNFFTTFTLNYIKPGLIWIETLCFSFLSKSTSVVIDSIFENFFILSRNLKNFNIYNFVTVCDTILLKNKCIFSSKVKYFYYKNIHKNTLDPLRLREISQKYTNLDYKKKKLDYFNSMFFLNFKLTKYFFLVFLFRVRTDFLHGSKLFFFYHDYSKYEFQRSYQKNMHFRTDSNVDMLVYYWNDMFLKKNNKKVLFENTYDYFLKTFDFSQTEISNSRFTLKHLSYFFFLKKTFEFSNKKKIGIKIFSTNWFMMHKTVCLTKNKSNIFNEKIKFFKNLIDYFESQQFLLEKKN